MLVILLFVCLTIANLIPENIILDVYQNDISDMTLSSNGQYICITTLGGDTKLLWTNGTLIQEFKRNESMGEYMVMCSFSPKNKYLIINSDLGYTSLCTKGFITIYMISPPILYKPFFFAQTSIRTNCEFPWPTTYAFGHNDLLFAYANYTSNTIIGYEFSNEWNVFNITTNTDRITTMIFSNDMQFLIWKQDSNGCTTMYELSTDHVYKQFYLGSDASDVLYYSMPSLMMTDDMFYPYLMDCSSNTGSMYVVNINNGSSYRLKTPWIGGTYFLNKDSLWYVSMLSRTFISTLSLYNLTAKTSKDLLPCDSSIFRVWFDYVGSLNGTQLILCSQYTIRDILRDNSRNNIGIDHRLPSVGKCLYGSWYNRLNQISRMGNIFYTTDVQNNLIKWTLSETEPKLPVEGSLRPRNLRSLS